MKKSKFFGRLNPYVIEDVLFVVVALALVLGIFLLGHQEYQLHQAKSHPAPHFTASGLSTPAALQKEIM